MPLEYSVLLMLLFYVLLLVEFLVPSGGIIGVAAAFSAIAAVIVASTHSWSAGLTVFLVLAISTPIILSLMVRVWPKTKIGQLILNRRPGETAAQPAEKTTNRGTPLSELVGSAGTAQTNLLPSGMVQIGGERIDAVSGGMPIDAGAAIVVASIKGNRVLVREQTPADAPESRSASENGDSEFADGRVKGVAGTSPALEDFDVSDFE